jgi:hypothetical protein
MYTAPNWYWIVAGSTTQVWSSARLGYFPVSDATYQAWLTAGNVATNIASTSDLLGVMTQQVVPLLQQQGVAVVSTATPALSGTYACDPSAQQVLSAITAGLDAGRGFPGGAASFAYSDVTGAAHEFSAQSDFLNMAAAIEGYVYQFTIALSALVGGQTAALPAPQLAIP